MYTRTLSLSFFSFLFVVSLSFRKKFGKLGAEKAKMEDSADSKFCVDQNGKSVLKAATVNKLIEYVTSDDMTGLKMKMKRKKSERSHTLFGHRQTRN
jgi:hypothetical protein